MTEMLLLILTACSVSLGGLFAGFETGMYSANRVRLRLQLELKSFGARSLSRLLRDLPSSMSTNLIGTNLTLYFSTACVTKLCEMRDISVLTYEFAATLILTPIVFIFAEMTPKDVFRRHADQWTYVIAPVMQVFHWILYPLAIGFRRAGSLVKRSVVNRTEEPPVISRLGLHAVIAEGREDGVLTTYQTAIAANITRLQVKKIVDVMVPLTEAVTIAGDAPLQELEEKAARNDISRLPVFDSQRRNIIGIVNVFDHLFEEEKGERVSDLLRTAPSLAEDDGIYAALVCLRRARMPMGIVRDDATQAVGIVTVKDLVEEIVGKLEAF